VKKIRRKTNAQTALYNSSFPLVGVSGC